MTRWPPAGPGTTWLLRLPNWIGDAVMVLPALRALPRRDQTWIGVSHPRAGAIYRATGWFDDLPRCVAGSSLFVCECTYADSIFEYHLSYAELTARKEEFDCGRIILTHLGAEMTDRRGRCDFETADDGLVIKL